VKKCPECGNPSYDGAQICGNCGHKFPKPKPIIPKEEKVEVETNDEDLISILKEKKLIIGIILLVTIIAICGIVISGNVNEITETASTLTTFSENGLSFNYPSDWVETNLSDLDHPSSVFFKNKENTTIQYYNISSNYASLNELTNQRISNAQFYGNYINTIQIVSIDGVNASNIILENPDGTSIRYVSILSDGTLYIYKISGDSLDAINSNDISNMLKSIKIS
jgi:hypothetical protein